MFTGKLHPYQHDGVSRILSGQRILVAYSMGTGKTVMTIAASEEMLGNGTVRTVLILVPASLKYQWAASLAQFTDIHAHTIRLRDAEVTVPLPEWCAVIDGTAKKRAQQWAHVQKWRPDYVIASYAAVLHDWQYVRDLAADAIVLDEATVIKNFSAQTTKRIKRLRPPVRIALTGTPVENRPEEIYSIMQWVNPETLGRWDLFDHSFIRRNWFGGVASYKNLDLLHKRLSSAMIRKSRLDPEVARHLPAVQETTHLVTLDKATRALYKRICADLAQALEELAETGESFDLAAYYSGRSDGGERSAQGKVMARLLALRLLLDHPALLMDSAVAYHEGKGEGSQYIAQLVAASDVLPDHTATPKLDELDRLVGVMLAEPGAKVAIFTSYRRMLPYLAERLDKHGDMVFFHGQMNAATRAGAKARFDTDPGCRMIVCTNAGGYGLDLPAAQYLVNYDLPDSRGVLDQRNSRHVRASSAHARVYVANLVVMDSVEERQQATLALRGALASAIVDGRGRPAIDNDVESLSEHLGRLF